MLPHVRIMYRQVEEMAVSQPLIVGARYRDKQQENNLFNGGSMLAEWASLFLAQKQRRLSVSICIRDRSNKMESSVCPWAMPQGYTSK